MWRYSSSKKLQTMNKFAIYQVLPRLFGNTNAQLTPNGTIQQNGCGKLNDFTPQALDAIKQLGVTHIWYTGIIEHATQTDYTTFGIAKDHDGVVKGRAGSPYAIKDYYDIDPDLAVDVNRRMEEFEELVTRTHNAGLKVLIDFVPNHTARYYHSDSKPKGIKDIGEEDNPEWAFSPLNNYYYNPHTPLQPSFDTLGYSEYPAKATGNDQFSPYPNQYDWYETVKLNYGVNYVEGMQKQFEPIPNTWHKMLDILLFWASKGIDGFRVDMAEMVPVEFWHWAIIQVKEQYPHLIFIAEVYTPSEYRNYICNGKFDYLYDKVGMYDTLRGIISQDKPARTITEVWQSLSGIENQMLNFLENHDEQRIASGFFSSNGIYAIPAMIVSATLNKAPFMIYFGQELGEYGMDMEGFSGIDGKTSIFDYWSVSSIRNWTNNGNFDTQLLSPEQKNLQTFYKRLIHISLHEKAITDGERYDLEFANYGESSFSTHDQYAYLRKYEDQLLLCITNFKDKDVEIGIKIPAEAFQYLGLKENEYYESIDLLSDSEALPIQKLSSEDCFQVSLSAWNGKIIKLIKKKL